MGDDGETLKVPADEWRLAETLRLLGFEMSYDADEEAHLVVCLVGGEGWPSQRVRIAMAPLRDWLGLPIGSVAELRRALATRGVLPSGDPSWTELKALLSSRG